MCQMPVFRYDDIPINAKLHLDLLIDQEDVMHLILKIRVFPFKIILDPEWFYIHLFEIFLEPWFGNCL